MKYEKHLWKTIKLKEQQHKNHGDVFKLIYKVNAEN